MSSESCGNSILGTGVEFCADDPPRGGRGVIMHISQTLVSIRVLLVLFGLTRLIGLIGLTRLFVRFAESSSVRSQIDVIN